MKTNWKNVAAIVLFIGAGFGISAVAIRSFAKADTSSVATMSDPSMTSMKPATSHCEMCSGAANSQCTDGSCPHSKSMTNMGTDQMMVSAGKMTPEMDGKKMSGEGMSNSMSKSMKEKSMTPSMGSPKMVEGEQMVVAPKM